MSSAEQHEVDLQVHIVYHGPPMSGKLSSMRYLYHQVRDEYKKIYTTYTSSATILLCEMRLPLYRQHERIGWADITLSTITGVTLEQKNYTDRLELSDGVIFVADSSIRRTTVNHDFLALLEQWEQQRSGQSTTYPVVFQYNKRDLPEAVCQSIEHMNLRLNPHKRLFVASVADAHFLSTSGWNTGDGVQETLMHVLNQCVAAHQVSFLHL